jgi:hypothetical protein
MECARFPVRAIFSKRRTAETSIYLYEPVTGGNGAAGGNRRAGLRIRHAACERTSSNSASS